MSDVIAQNTYRPFDSGTQYEDWFRANCEKCAHENHCPLEDAVLEAGHGEGSVQKDVAERIGYLDNSPPRAAGFVYVWSCKEWEAR